MVDAGVLVREYLLTQAGVTALLGSNPNGSIYCAYDLPEGFDPKLGPAIQVFRSGGHSHSEITPLVDARLTVRAWADVEEYTEASSVYGAVHDVLHGLCRASVTDGTIVRAQEVEGPLEMTDPETGWVAMYAFYQVMATPNAGPGVYTPQFYEGEGAPEALYNQGDLYYDESTGNLYEQVAGAWLYLANITGGGGSSDMPSLKFHHVSTAGTNAVNVKSVPGTVTGWQLSNDTEFPCYVKLFDKATTPIPGTDTPAQTIMVQAGEAVSAPPGPGISYSNGIGLAITLELADLDSTAVSAGGIVADIFYQ